MSMIVFKLLLWFLIAQMSELMVVVFLIGSLLVLVSLLTNLISAGTVVGGVMLTVIVLMLVFRLVGVSALFLGLFNLFRELRCGESFWRLT